MKSFAVLKENLSKHGYEIAIGAVLVISFYVARLDSKDCQNIPPVAQTKSMPSQFVNINKASQSQESTHYGTEKGAVWRTFFHWPDGASTWILIVTLFAVAKQAKHTAESAQAANRSIQLQAIQWIGINKWIVKDVTESNGAKKGNGTPQHCIRIQAEIINNSSFPITIKKAQLFFTGNQNGQVTLTSFGLSNRFLAPKISYLPNIDLNVSSTQIEQFSNGNLSFNVKGDFFLAGAENDWTQHLEGNLQCGSSASIFTDDFSFAPDELSLICHASHGGE